MIQFPPFILDPVEERLWKGKTQLTLRRKPFAILRYLVANPSRLVTHDELLEHVWGGNAVSESAVRSQLHELRQVLGDGVIDTVIGRGYRFVAKLAAAVEPVTQAAAPLIDSTMVGRAAELAALETALDGALTGRRQICFITGEPGIGKTTLVDRFLTGLEARGVRCVRGHCIEQYGTPEPYLPMIELLGRLRKTDQGEQVIATLVRHAPSFAAQLPHLMTDAQFADVSRRAGPGAETRTMRELVESIEALCADQILVIALEDLQWSDVATIDMLSLLGQRKERAKLLVVATSRRAESQTVTHPLNRVMRTLLTRSGATAIPLDRIDRDAISSFLELRFPKHTFPESFLELLERTTAGTPLFMVSFLGELVDRGMIESRDTGWALALASDEIADYQPSTVRQLIDIQLDRLEAQEQRVLEAASLVGPVFSIGLVAAALGITVEQVEEVCVGLAQRALFLIYAGEEEWPNGAIHMRYGVTHALVQEVCFARCPTSRRSRWHRSIAEHLEAATGERAGEMAHVLATHFEQAQLVARAVHYYVIAGTRTASRFSLADASRLYHRANALIARLPETGERDAIELRVLVGMSQAVTLSSDRTRHVAVEQFERMITIARRLVDLPQLYSATVNLYFRHGTLAEYAAADVIERELEALEQASPVEPKLRLFADGARGIHAMWKGELHTGLALLEPITSDRANTGPIGGILGQADRVAFLLIYQCTMRWASGDAEVAIEEANRGVAQAIRIGDPYTLGATLCILARLHFLRRDDPREVREAADRVATIPEADVWYTQAALYAAAARSQQTGPLPQAEIDELARMFEHRTGTFPMGAPALALPLVEILRIAGQLARAAALVETMLAFIEAHREFLLEPELLRLRGELVEEANPAAAAAAYAQAVTSARLRSARSFELRAAIRLARLRPEQLPQLATVVATFAKSTSRDVAEARALLA